MPIFQLLIDDYARFAAAAAARKICRQERLMFSRCRQLFCHTAYAAAPCHDAAMAADFAIAATLPPR